MTLDGEVGTDKEIERFFSLYRERFYTIKKELIRDIQDGGKEQV